MKNITKRFLWLLLPAALLLMPASCSVKYSATGASILPGVKTYSVQPFQNVASMVAPSLANLLTETLLDKFSRSTSLTPVSEDGDMAFEGEITGYTSNPIAVTGDEYASQNRLTVTVRVKYENKIDPKKNFSKVFSAYQNYDNTQMLQQVESTLLPDIVDDLVTDIFNASAADW